MSKTNRNRLIQGEKLRGADKVRRIPVKVVPTEKMPRKPDWLRVRVPASPEISRIKNILRARRLASVCEEATCPNLPECFSKGTATFMIMGEICTRRCPFCDVAHGKPNPLDPDEPRQLASAVAEMNLKYIVVTSVDRDDVKDSGAGHFAECIRELREQNPQTRIEVLVPDFRGRMELALEKLSKQPPDVFNHTPETLPR
ncbi:MAG: lipoyl synthase, partial [Pseudomonadales bacterium]|nr:lipoyl synthase [Pseudomonadales bacterium]